MLALMLCTGVRAAELLALDVDDLQVMFGSTLALRIKSGKGSKQRLIPYGAQDWGLTLTQQWLDRSGISSGAVFVGMRKGDNFYLDKEGKHVFASRNGLWNTHCKTIRFRLMANSELSLLMICAVPMPDSCTSQEQI